MRTTSFIGLFSRFTLIALVAASLASAGCDSNDDDGNGNEDGDAEVLVGVWNATSVSAGPIDVLGILGLTLTLTLDEDGTGMIVAIDEDDNRTELTGSYTVDETAKTITLAGDDLPEDLTIEYEIIDSDNLEVEFDAEALEDLGFDLGTIGGLLSGVPITVELERATS